MTENDNIHYLKYKNEIIAEINLTQGLYEPRIIDIRVINNTLLPPAMKNKTGDRLIEAAYDWFKGRTIPNSRFDIDDFLIGFFGCKSCSCGRMYGYQYIPAYLSHYRSYFDNYSIDINSSELKFYGYEDRALEQLYIIKPIEDETFVDCSDEIKDREYKKIENIRSLLFTIPSNMQSWFQNGTYLYQKISRQQDIKVIQDKIRIIKKYISDYKIESKGELIITDFSDKAGMDVSWLSDMLGTDYIHSDFDWKRYVKKILPGSDNSIKVLSLIMEDFQKGKLKFSLNNIGFGVLNEDVFPVVIL